MGLCSSADKADTLEMQPQNNNGNNSGEQRSPDGVNMSFPSSDESDEVPEPVLDERLLDLCKSTTAEVDLCRDLITSGINVHAQLPYGSNATALCLAAKNGLLEILREILKAGASVNQTDGSGMTPLMHSAMCRKRSAPDIAKELIQAGASLDEVCEETKTALLYAVEYSCTPIVEELVRAGASLGKALHKARSQSSFCPNDQQMKEIANILSSADRAANNAEDKDAAEEGNAAVTKEAETTEAAEGSDDAAAEDETGTNA